MSTTSRCYLNQRTIQLLMGVTGRIGGQTRQGQDQFVEILFVVSSEAEYQDYLYVLAGRREQTRMLFYWDITMQSRPNAQPVEVTPITNKFFKKAFLPSI